MARLGDAFVGVSPNLTGFGAQLQGKLSAALKGVKASVPVTADIMPALGDIAALRLRAAALLAKSVSLRATVDTKAALASLLSLQATFAAVGKALDRSSIGDAALLRLQARLITAEVGLDRVAAAAERDAPRIDLVSGAALRGWGAFGLLTNKVQLFGGALTAVGLPAVIAAAGGIHILTDAAVEVAAVLVPATIALGAFGAGAAPTIRDIARQMQAVLTTSTALGTNLYPLTDAFTQMEAAVKPSVLQLFGEALVVVGHNTGLFTTIAVQAGKALDDLGARAAAALTSGGFAVFLRQGPHDLAVIGDVIGNIFGTIGNLLRVMPGYAQVLLGALDGVTKGIEAVTTSGLGQWIAGVALAGHGFLLWAGLAATAAVWLGNGLVTLAAKFGLAEAGAVAFDAAQFGAGIKLAFSYAVDLGGALVTLAGAEDIAAAASGVLQGALIALDAVNPLVWIGLAAAALGYLVYNLTRTTTYTNAYAAAAQAALENVPVSQLGIDLTRQQSAAMSDLAATAGQLAASGPSGGQAFARFWSDPAAAARDYTGAQKQAVAQYGDLLSRQADDKALIGTLQGDYANYSAVLKAAGGNVSLLNDAGLTSNQILTANASQLRQYEIEVQAAADAQQALGLGVGRSAAALNAQTNVFLQETVPAMQKVITAEDQVLSVVTGGQTAFNNFQQSIQGTTAKFVSPTGLADAFTLAKGNLTGLNEQSLAYSNTLYSIAIPNLQKLVGATELQGISTGDLTKVVATGAGQILQYTGKNTEARSVIVDLINNALGPGTVSLQNLNTWVGKNSTSLDGMNGIIATSTIKAGNFSGVLNSSLNPALAQSVINAYGGQKAFNDFAAGVVNGQEKGQDFVKSGQSVLNTLIASSSDAADAKKKFEDYAINGLGQTKQQADLLWASLVRQKLTDAASKAGETKTQFEQLAGQLGDTKGQADLLWDSLKRLTASGYSANVTVAANGTVNVNGYAISAGAYFSPHAAGGFISGGVPGKDSVPGMLMPGEVVVPVPMVAAGAVDHLRGKLPGFAAGGLVGTRGNLTTDYPQIAASTIANVTLSVTDKIAEAATKAFAKYVAQQQAATFNPLAGSAGGPTPSGPLQAYARALVDQTWNDSQWPPFADVVNRESGWNVHATNPSSGAYGIPQALPASKMASAGADWATNGYTQLRWMVGYIRSRWGTPAGADANEIANHWYAAGGLVGPLAAAQKGEKAKYFGLQHSFADGPKKYLTHGVVAELTALTRNQAAELRAVAGISTGVSASRWKQLAAAAKAESSTAGGWWLSHQPGGHPLYAHDLRAYLAAVGSIAAQGIAGFNQFGGPVNPPWTPGNLGASHTAPGGVVTFDRGGTLAPGFNPVWNGTGRNEHLVPDGGGTIIVNVENHGWIGSEQQLEDQLTRVLNKMSRTGRLTQAVKRAGG